MGPFVVGLALGLLLQPISAGWFEAVGTGVGAFVSTAAVILAVIIFRSEDSCAAWIKRAKRAPMKQPGAANQNALNARRTL
jgi:hypothetical protein